MDGAAEIILDHPGSEFQQLPDNLRLGPGVGRFVGNSLDAAQAYEAEQRSDLMSDAQSLATSIDNARVPVSSNFVGTIVASFDATTVSHKFQ